MNKLGYWDLSVLYKGFSDPLFSSEISGLKTELDNFLSYFQPIVASDDGVAKNQDSLEQIKTCSFAITSLQKIERLYSRLSIYIQLILSVDATNSEALANQDVIDGFEPIFQVAISTFSRYMATIKDINVLLDEAKKTKSADLIQEHSFFLKEAKEN